jgi:hypothetical protein
MGNFIDWGFGGKGIQQYASLPRYGVQDSSLPMLLMAHSLTPPTLAHSLEAARLQAAVTAPITGSWRWEDGQRARCARPVQSDEYWHVDYYH